jgi:hypothetical protein
VDRQFDFNVKTSDSSDLVGLRPLDYRPKEDDDLDMGLKNNTLLTKSFKNPNITIDWSV